MRELELREKKINDIQVTGDRLIKDGHPGKKTVEVRGQLFMVLKEDMVTLYQKPLCIMHHKGLLKGIMDDYYYS